MTGDRMLVQEQEKNKVKKDIQKLLEKYNQQECSPEELRALEAWFLEIGDQHIGSLPDDERIQHIWQQIQTSPRFAGQIPPEYTKPKWLKRMLYTTVAAVLLVLGLIVLLDRPQQAPAPMADAMADIAPGEDRAILTLANGEKIVLDSSGRGIIAEIDGITIQKNEDGSIVYILSESTDQDMAHTYNTIETPRGGQYQVILSDGSRVWLNAESSLIFPARFAGHAREVRIRGEAYFSVTNQQGGAQTAGYMPFVVETDQHRVEVLGTEFNVNAFPRQHIQKTTLVEGSVRVQHKASQQQTVLKPGQQAWMDSNMKVVEADLEKEIAWKNGDFIYKDERLADILQDVSRWYDVEVTCPERLAAMRFSGMVSRKRSLSSIIAMLESTGTIKVNVKERRIIVE